MAGVFRGAKNYLCALLWYTLCRMSLSAARETIQKLLHEGAPREIRPINAVAAKKVTNRRQPMWLV
jgi:hypothetical protein